MPFTGLLEAWGASRNSTPLPLAPPRCLKCCCGEGEVLKWVFLPASQSYSLHLHHLSLFFWRLLPQRRGKVALLAGNRISPQVLLPSLLLIWIMLYPSDLRDPKWMWFFSILCTFLYHLPQSTSLFPYWIVLRLIAQMALLFHNGRCTCPPIPTPTYSTAIR